jgi:hypothetical protein
MPDSPQRTPQELPSAPRLTNPKSDDIAYICDLAIESISVFIELYDGFVVFVVWRIMINHASVLNAVK